MTPLCHLNLSLYTQLTDLGGSFFFCPIEIKLELKRGHKVKEMCDKKRVSSAEIKMHDFRRVKLSQLNAHI